MRPLLVMTNLEKLREVRRREGKYLIRANLPDREDPSSMSAGEIWKYYMQLAQLGYYPRIHVIK